MVGMDRREPEDLADSGTPEMDGLPLRCAGRVIVLDPDGRVLLLRYDNDPPDGRHWATPGGA
jgi:ADP-ribose pyrophosphatase YjhB (NUDIX family)